MLRTFQVEPIKEMDKKEIINFHRAARVSSDYTILKDYTLAAVHGGYYEAFWDKHFNNIKEVQAEKAYKLTQGGEIKGFVRFGIIDAPTPQSFWEEKNKMWAEIHQLYVDPCLFSKGLGSMLFCYAKQELQEEGVTHILVNVLQGNKQALSFYSFKGAQHREDVIEWNERNGQIFKVPCSLLVLDISGLKERDIEQAKASLLSLRHKGRALQEATLS